MSFHNRKKPNFVGCGAGSWGSFPVDSGVRSGVSWRLSVSDLSGVHQHDWDIVLNGVYAAAFAAPQAFAVRVQDHRFPANGADEHFEQILGNHRDIIVMPRDSAREDRSQLPCSGELRNTGEFDAIESPFHLLLDLLHGAAR